MNKQKYPIYYFAAFESKLANMIAVNRDAAGVPTDYDEKWLEEMFYWTGKVSFGDLTKDELDTWHSIRHYIGQYAPKNKADLKREYEAIQSEYNIMILDAPEPIISEWTMIDEWMRLREM